MAGWREGKAWVTTEGQSLLSAKGRGTGSWGLIEVILGSAGLGLKEERKGRACNS